MATVGLQVCDVVDCLPRSKDPFGLHQECVLLIEDSEEAMLLVRYALQEYGNGTYRLEWANGLTSGLLRLSKGDVDLILLDLGLPESSGAETYLAIRKAAPELPILVLTGDTREQTEFTITANGVEDYLVKDDISGSLLLQAIRSALYSNRHWLEQKTSAYKQTQRFHWAQEKCEALRTLATRLLKSHKTDAVLACGKAIAGIIENYGESEGAAVAGRADLFTHIERLARAASSLRQKDAALQLRALITPASQWEQARRLEFDAALRQRSQQLDGDHDVRDPELPLQDTAELAQLLRQILDSVPSLS